MFGPWHGVESWLMAVLLGMVSGLVLLVALLLAITGRRGSRLRRTGAALAMGAGVTALVAVGMLVYLGTLEHRAELDHLENNPGASEWTDEAAVAAMDRADGASGFVASGAVAAGIVVGVVSARGLRRRDDGLP